VVGTDLLVAALDLVPAARRVLVDVRLAKADLPAGRRQHEIAIRSRAETGALELDGDDVRICAGPHDEVELETPLRAVVDGIDAGVDVAVAHTRIARHVRAPMRGVLSHVVTAQARQPVRRLGGGEAVRASQAHPDQGGGSVIRAGRHGTRRQRQEGPCRTDSNRVSRSPSCESRGTGGIGRRFERQGEPCVEVARVEVTRARWRRPAARLVCARRVREAIGSLVAESARAIPGSGAAIAATASPAMRVLSSCFGFM
jgi:hypothetical protein